MPEYNDHNLYDLADEYLTCEEENPIAEYIKRKAKRLRRRHQFKRHQHKHAHIVHTSPFLCSYVKRTGAKDKIYYLKRSMGSKHLKAQASRAFRRDKTGNTTRRSFHKKVYDYWWNLW